MSEQFLQTDPPAAEILAPVRPLKHVNLVSMSFRICARDFYQVCLGCAEVISIVDPVGANKNALEYAPGRKEGTEKFNCSWSLSGGGCSPGLYGQHGEGSA